MPDGTESNAGSDARYTTALVRSGFCKSQWPASVTRPCTLTPAGCVAGRVAGWVAADECTASESARSASVSVIEAQRLHAPDAANGAVAGLATPPAIKQTARSTI